MSKIDKALARLRSVPTDFTWQELELIMNYFGYNKIEGSGSRTKFLNPDTHVLLHLHRPHPKPILKSYALKIIINHLNDEGLL